MSRIVQVAAAAAAIALIASSAQAATGQAQLSFSETGYTTTYSSLYNAGDDIQFTQDFGGYHLLISADSDNLFGNSALGANPFLSIAIQVGNVGNTPPANPIKVGLSVTGIDPSYISNISFDTSFTGIFYTTGASANFHTYYDTSNLLFGRTYDLSRFDGVSKTSSSYDQTLLDTIASPFSMSLYLTFTPTANAHPTLDG
jgi:hypothetical protein